MYVCEGFGERVAGAMRACCYGWQEKWRWQLIGSDVQNWVADRTSSPCSLGLPIVHQSLALVCYFLATDQF